MGEKVIYTVGSSDRSPEEFIGLLKSYGIEKLIDVRRFPTSKFEHFQKENLFDLLENEGVQYLYLGEKLGGYRRGGYEKYMDSPAFESGMAELEGSAMQARCVIMCAERLPWRCHRRFIARSLERRDWKVIHILDEKRTWTMSKDAS
ncbi:MAG TPA: DUF488 domain-containing protein [Candidatus Latescibacteria bacterium]|nr:DUF488 domain-containing protein [Candidatus Latescibacterota bacterium]